MNIEDNIEKGIRTGLYVFKIIGITSDGSRRNVDMVSTFNDYKQKLENHVYTPLLYKLNFQDRIAYLFGCLNYEYGITRQEIFEVYFRKVSTKTWKIWYVIKPTLDLI